jgi:hypothetical protein
MSGSMPTTFQPLAGCAPGHLWRAMRRNAAWIEPTLIAEWMRVMRDYARNQNRPISEDKMFAAMRWSDPDRDVSRAREIALGALQIGNLRCAWTDRPPSRKTLDIDHMFPWTAWPCSDLWNLLPAHREVKAATQARPITLRDRVLPCGGPDRRLVGAGVSPQFRELLTRAVLG